MEDKTPPKILAFLFFDNSKKKKIGVPILAETE